MTVKALRKQGRGLHEIARELRRIEDIDSSAGQGIPAVGKKQKFRKESNRSIV